MRKLATIHFDGGGQSPGPVTAACTVELSDGSFDQAVKRFDQGTQVKALRVPEFHLDLVQMGKALSTLGRTAGGGMLEHARQSGSRSRLS